MMALLFKEQPIRAILPQMRWIEFEFDWNIATIVVDINVDLRNRVNRLAVASWPAKSLFARNTL